MRQLVMKNGAGAECQVQVDDSKVIDSGGFGSVYAAPHDTDYIVKRVELSPPQPIGNIPGYVAHIRTTRDRLLEIKREELAREQPRPFILKSIDEIVDHALSTHWAFDLSGTEISAVWFRQRIAPGKKLLAAFGDAPPELAARVKIAKNLVARMRTLRRADLVHLDCVADNIFVDGANVALIDLDGCGIVRRDGSGKGSSDQWDHRPLTLGHLEVLRPPPWYPQVGVELGPKTGNYLFGERWGVIDTVIRILTWNKFSALSWLASDTRLPIVNGYKSIRRVLEAAKARGEVYGGRAWAALCDLVLAELRIQVGVLPVFLAPTNHPQCLQDFASLAQSACLDPRLLGSSGGSPYDIYRDWLR